MHALATLSPAMASPNDEHMYRVWVGRWEVAVHVCVSHRRTHECVYMPKLEIHIGHHLQPLPFFIYLFGLLCFGILSQATGLRGPRSHLSRAEVMNGRGHADFIWGPESKPECSADIAT